MMQTLIPRKGTQNLISYRLLFLIFCLLHSVLRCPGVEHFGDIDVTPQSLVSGETYHGYREFRILLENHSIKYTHTVTLIYPENSYRSGNSISRLSRTVSIGPSSSMMVPLWQPPLPVNGDTQMRVLVDDEEVGKANLQDASRHIISGGARYSSHYGGSVVPAAILVSRSLNFDELNHALNAKNGGADYSAQMALGPPDSARRGTGMAPTAWSPDPSSSGPHWIELDYATPAPMQRVRLYSTEPLPPGTQIILKGISGTNLFQTNIPPFQRIRGGITDFPFPLTGEPVKTVRLEFGSQSASSISIDAVELIGPAGSAWAANAHASSDATSAYGSSPSGGNPARGLLRTELPMSEWSDSWLSHTPFDAIALNESDLKALPPAAFNALWSYVECGGNLFVFGAHSVPEPWRAFQKVTLPHGEYRNIGLGRCFFFEEDKISSMPADSVKAMIDAADSTARYWSSLPDENSANQSFPVVQNYQIPVRSTVFIMLLFVIAIGPVNLIVLSKMNRRTWLLWTIPAISFLTCFTVFAYSYLREGITPDTRISGFTLLDQANRRAASIGLTAFYCPLTPSQGLFFNSITEATPLIEMWDYSSGTDREVDWSQSQHLGRGWVSARVPAYFELRKPETRRERLEVEIVNGQLTVVNGLGAAIKTLWLADGSSRLYKTTNIPAGQKATLSPSTESLKKDEQLGGRALLEKCGAEANLGNVTLPVSYLLPNTYIAELDANPFLENGLGSKAQSARTKSRAVVYGSLESPAQP